MFHRKQKSYRFIFLLFTLLLSVSVAGCRSEGNMDEHIVETTTISTEETQRSVPSPTMDTIPSEAVEEAIPWLGLYWMDGEDRPQHRCLIQNTQDAVLSVSAASAVYYRNGEVVQEDFFDTAALKKIVQSGDPNLELTIGDSCCLWITTELSVDDYDSACCSVTTVDSSGNENVLEYWFTTDKTAVSKADHWADQELHYAVRKQDGWQFYCFPLNTTDETLYLEATHEILMRDGVPVVTGSKLEKDYQLRLLSAFGELFPGEEGILNFSTSDMYCTFNQREFTFVYRNAAGEPFLQTYRFVMDKDKAVRIEDIEGPVATVYHHAYAVAQENPDRYASVIDFYQIPEGFGTPEYTVAEIREMITENLSVDQVAEKLSTYADVVQFLYLRNYQVYNGNELWELHFFVEDIEWGVNVTPQISLDLNMGNCGSTSNLINYLLQGDYDAQGYVAEAARDGGHVYNYFKSDGVYYVSDIIQIITVNSTWDNADYRVFTTPDLKIYSAFDLGRKNKGLTMEDEAFVQIQYFYPYEGSHRPVGMPDEEDFIANILSDEIQDRITMLYVAQDRYAPTFAPAPPLELWPEDAKG